jgi:two-component system, cell cycle sensor histidine kinase and response regulator CckA
MSVFDLFITHQATPELTVLDPTKEVIALRPDMPIILCTGFSHLVDADSVRAAGVRPFAMKPLTKKELAQIIRKVLDEPAAK